MQYQHGGDVYSFLERFPKQMPLDFSANINPRGMPAPVQEAIQTSISACMQYPDPYCRTLRSALGKRWALSPDCIFCGNGAAELFYRLIDCIAPKRALLLAPTFLEYAQALQWKATDITHLYLRREEAFAVNLSEIKTKLSGQDILFLCNPNNPTGGVISATQMQEILQLCKMRNIWLIVDECFHDFLPNAVSDSMRWQIATYPRLVVVRAFTKMYAMPGIRLGYCLTANTELLAQMERAGQPWAVSVIAQMCGEAALTCTGWEQETAQYIEELRITLQKALESLGLHVFSGSANYLLFQTDCFDLRERLMPYGILIRDCSNYEGLCAGYFRIAVRTQPENERLLSALKEVLEIWRRSL